MTKVAVKTRYRVSDLWASPDLAGKVLTIQEGQFEVVVRLPSDQSTFQSKVDATDGTVIIPSLRVSGNMIGIQVFAVEVAYEAEIFASQPETMTDEDWEVGRQVILPAQEVGTQAAFRLLRWLKVLTGQVWLGQTIEPPVPYGRTGLYNAVSGDDLMGLGPRIEARMRPSLLKLDEATFQVIGKYLALGQDVPIVDALMADAWHLAEGRQVQDGQVAVILAAAACEIRVQEVLRQRVAQDRKDLLEQVLRRTSKIRDLASSVLFAALGMSLKVEDPALFKAVGRLSDVRNGVLHEGASVDPAEIRSLLVAGRSTLAWLAAI